MILIDTTKLTIIIRGVEKYSKNISHREAQLDDEKALHIKCTLSVVEKCPIALYRRKMSQNFAIWLVAISTRRANSHV